MHDRDDEIWDNVFHVCAFRAYMEQAIEQGGSPDMELTRLRADRLYEDALAEKNRQRNRRAYEATQEILL